MPTGSLWIPLNRPSKHEELVSRPVPARGPEVKPQVDTLLAEAEERALNAVAARAFQAAKHNQKASAIAIGAKMADTLVFHERKLNCDLDMAAHEKRQKKALNKKAAKGRNEVNKVAAAVAALQDAAVVAERAKMEALAEADRRRAARLEEVAAKGAAETAKVVQAAEKLQAEADAKAAQIAADALAAEERREEHLKRVMAKGSAASEKVTKAAKVQVDESVAKAEALEAKLMRADLYRSEVRLEGVTKEQAKHEAVLARREASITASLEKAAAQATRELEASRKREAELERVAAKARAQADKVAAANDRLASATATKASKIEEKHAAAAARKAGVQYPPCARAPKVTAIVPRRLGPLRKMALAFAGGALARSLFFWGAKMGGFAKLSSTLITFGTRFGKRSV